MQEKPEGYGIMKFLELAVNRCGRWVGSREFVWSGLSTPNCGQFLYLMLYVHHASELCTLRWG